MFVEFSVPSIFSKLSIAFIVKELIVREETKTLKNIKHFLVVL